MKKLLFLPILIFLFSCESEAVDSSEDDADSLLFPEVACGEMAIEIDGFLSVYPDVFSLAGDLDLCRVIFNAQLPGPASENRLFHMILSPPEVGTFILEETGVSNEYCEYTRMTWQYSYSPDPEGSRLPQFGYSSRPTWGGFGYLEITELEFNFDDDLPDYISGQFEYTAGLFFDETGLAPETVVIRGSFCEIPIEDKRCFAPPNAIC